MITFLTFALILSLLCLLFFATINYIVAVFFKKNK